jgi:hypothetical protein
MPAKARKTANPPVRTLRTATSLKLGDDVATGDGSTSAQATLGAAAANTPAESTTSLGVPATRPFQSNVCPSGAQNGQYASECDERWLTIRSSLGFDPATCYIRAYTSVESGRAKYELW